MLRHASNIIKQEHRDSNQYKFMSVRLMPGHVKTTKNSNLFMHDHEKLRLMSNNSVMVPFPKSSLMNNDLKAIKKDDFESIKIEGTKAQSNA